MNRSFVLAAAALGLAALALPADAGTFVVPNPPAVLSADLTGPWVLQVHPGKRPFLADPVAHSAAFSRPLAMGRGFNPAFVPRVVAYSGHERPGTIVIDTEARYLYFVLDDGSARRYGVGVGRPGFEWAGVHTITRKAEWPVWTPPPEMVKRQPWLPASMKGGPANPLGARAMYLGDTDYRIHGSNEPWTIGHAVSSGCIRMRNEDVIDLYNRVKVGTRVVVI
jgi:lipoprotein-anchoring transpeptidase ErfK/SrfK